MENQIEAQIKGIKVTPAHFNKNGHIDRDEFATVTINVPMNNNKARQRVMDLFQFLSHECVKVEVTEIQPELPGIEAKTKTQSASLSAEDVENQLKTAESV